MKKLARYLNVILFLLGAISLFFSLKVLNQKINPGEISATYHAKFLFGYFALFLSVLGMLFSLWLLFFRPQGEIVQRIKNIGFWALFGFVALYLLEFVVFGLVNSFIRVSKMTRIPPKDQFLDSMVFIILDYPDDFLKGVFMTLELSLVGTLIGLLLGMVLVVLRIMQVHPQDNEAVALLKKLGVGFSKLYINVFRGTPMIVQAVIIYYLLPSLLAEWLNVPISQIDKVLTISLSGIIIVSLNTTAYLAEVLRGGIEAVDKGQLEAARSLGLSYSQSMLSVVFPQAIKNALPSICNEFIINIKDTSVLNVIGVAELFFVANEAQFRYYRTYEPFIIVALIYFVLTMTTSKLLGLLEKKLNLPAKTLPSSN